MTNWKCVKMSKPEGESYWVNIQVTMIQSIHHHQSHRYTQDTREGAHYYKFLVDGEWSVEETENKVEKEDNNWNVMEVTMFDVTNQSSNVSR